MVMTRIINIEANTYKLSELLALVRGGDEVIVQEANMPAVKLSLADTSMANNIPKPLVVGLFEGQGIIPDDFDDELPMEFWLGEGA
jgi:antitoxin (DNA-binding transcriptional repressor) of toxin-antitoxin stability system